MMCRNLINLNILNDQGDENMNNVVSALTNTSLFIGQNHFLLAQRSILVPLSNLEFLYQKTALASKAGCTDVVFIRLTSK
jgi:hypothetical protein